MLIEKSFSDLIEEFGSAKPAPGGGSAAAASSVIAASLGKMVCELTLGRKKYADVAEEVTQIRERLGERISKLRALVDEDANAYQNVLAVRKMPAETDEEKEKRDNLMEQSMRLAAFVPIQTISESLLVLEDLDRLLRIGNPTALTDTGTAVSMVNAAIMGAYLNVRVNLPNVNNEDFTAKSRDLIDQALLQSSDKMKTAFQYLNDNLD